MTSPIKIRGVYATALTKIFLDAGFDVVEPSSSIKDRFPGVTFSNQTPGIEIEDRYDKEGIFLTFRSKNLASSELPLNFSNYSSLVHFQAHVLKDAIYFGEVVKNDYKRKTSLVLLERGDSPNTPFRSKPVAVIDDNLDIGKRLIVQVENPSYLSRIAKVSHNVTLSNDLLVLILNSNRVLVSRKIQDREKRNALKALGREAHIPYGIIFRTASWKQLENDKSVLLESVESLKKEMDQVLQRADAMRNIGLLRDGKLTWDFVFPEDIKKSLDIERRKLLPTIQGHHRFKAGARDYQHEGYSRAVDFCESMMEKFPDHKDIIEQEFKQTYAGILKQGDTIRIEHQKLDGRKFYLTPGTIQKMQIEENVGFLRVFRRLSPGGYLDGLDVPKEYGDYAINIYKFGEWYTEVTYYDEHNNVKGKYFNINTPPELTFNSIHYVDLEIDVVEKGTSGVRETVDKDKLENAYLLGVISERLYKKARETAKALKKVA